MSKQHSKLRILSYVIRIKLKQLYVSVNTDSHEVRQLLPRFPSSFGKAVLIFLRMTDISPISLFLD